MAASEKLRVSFIGAGRMATAMAAGMAGAFTDAELITASDPSREARDSFSKSTGCSAIESNDVAITTADVVVLAVKPQYLQGVAEQIEGKLNNDQLIVSIVAGYGSGDLREMLGEVTRIVRVMPNTPALIGAGMSAVASEAGESDLAIVRRMMAAVGDVVTVPESQMDAVTGLSGSGPAYVYQFIEALSDGGVLAGLPRDVSTKLAARTVLGAARMVLETGSHPGELKDAVTSPGGTTISGLHALEAAGMRGAVMGAVLAATNRSIELG